MMTRNIWPGKNISRIPDMDNMMSFIEKSENVIKEEDVGKAYKKMKKRNIWFRRFFSINEIKNRFNLILLKMILGAN